MKILIYYIPLTRTLCKYQTLRLICHKRQYSRTTKHAAFQYYKQ